MRIDYVSMPEMEGKSPQEALKALYAHCRETAMLVMSLNNKLEDLERKYNELESKMRFK